MQRLILNPSHPDPKIISQAVEIITSGGVVICPTDTVYILATNALDETAIKKIFEIKGRNEQKPIHVNVRDFQMATTLVDFNAAGQLLFEKFTPGPITVVLPKKTVVPDSLTGGLPTLGIRIPNNSVTLSLGSLCSVPYTTTSANPSGGNNPYSIDQILQSFPAEKLAHIDLILDCGELPPTSPSTVVEVTSLPPKVLRQGPISEAKITEVLTHLES